MIIFLPFFSGAIADFDGDGTLDLVIVYQFVGDMSIKSDRLGRKLFSEMKKYNLADVAQHNEKIPMTTTVLKDYGPVKTRMDGFYFSNLEEQQGNQYFGKEGTSHYKFPTSKSDSNS